MDGETNKTEKTQFQEILNEEIIDGKTIRDLFLEIYKQLSSDRKKAEKIVNWLFEVGENNNASQASKITSAQLLTETMKRLEKSNENMLKMMSEIQRVLSLTIDKTTDGLDRFNVDDIIDQLPSTDESEIYREQEPGPKSIEPVVKRN